MKLNQKRISGKVLWLCYHHGSLTQLFTYNKNSDQILLTPKQTHIINFDVEKLTNPDAYSFLDKYSKYNPLADLVKNYSMTQYIQNIFFFLKELLNKSLKTSYITAIDEIINDEDKYRNGIKNIDDEHQRLYNKYKVNDALKYKSPTVDNINKLKKLPEEKEILQVNLLNRIIVRKEIERILNDDQLKPDGSLFLSNKTLPIDIIKQVKNGK